MQASFRYKPRPRQIVRGTRWQSLLSIRPSQVFAAYLLSWSYLSSRSVQTSITCFGLARVFFSKTARINTASRSVRYIIRQVTRSSLMRSSWHRSPIAGIGLEFGKLSFSPRCNRRSSKPASSLAAAENGGVLTAPCNHTSSLPTDYIPGIICHM